MSIISTQVKDNLIINGGMRVAQQGTSFVSPAGGICNIDRFGYNYGGDMRHTITRDTDAPTLAQTGVTTQYSLKIDCTTADSSIAAGDVCWIYQNIEGYNIAPYVGRNLTFSFWVKATKTGTYCISAVSSGNDKSYVAEYTVSATNTWEKKIIIIPMNYSGGTWNYTNGRGLLLSWCLASGSTYQGTANTWNTGLAFATSNQVNACDSTDNNFWLANVKLEPGSVATKYEPRRFEEELRLCQRYFVAYGGTSAYEWLGIGSSSTTSNVNLAINTPVELRIPASSISYSDVGHWATLANATVSAITLQGTSTTKNTAVAFTSTGQTVGQSVLIYANNTTSARLYINAEL